MFKRNDLFAGLLAVLAFTIPAASQTVVSTVAGNSTWGTIYRLALDSAGNIYAADYTQDVVYKVDHLGMSTVVAGIRGDVRYSGDGGLATSASFRNPNGLAVTPDGGTLYIADSGPNAGASNDRIRKVASNGIITTYAGTGVRGFSGDNGPALNARISVARDLHLDSSGALYFVDWGNIRIRRIGTDGVITTVAGSGNSASSPDGNPATSTNMDPRVMALGGDGAIYFSDEASGTVRVRKFKPPNGVVTTVAGTGAVGFSGDGGPATAAKLEGVSGLLLDSGGNLYIAGGDRIRKVAPNGIITTFAGTGITGYSGDGGDALSARFSAPAGMVLDSQGALYVADSGNDKIRKIVSAFPTISFTDATVSAFLGKSAFGSNMYVTIYGSNLSTVTQAWDSAFAGSNAPTSLGGVSVTVNNIPAFIQYVSPTQININTPDDTATGPVNIVVKNALGISNTGIATRARLSPTLLSVPSFATGGTNYVVAQTPNFASFIGPPNLVQGAPFVAAKPGDTVIIFSVGSGPTTPATPAGVVAAQNSPLALPFQLKIGGVPATVPFAGVLAGTVGLYQFNVVIPAVAPGDQPIELIVDGVPNQQNLMITVGQ